MLCRRHCHSQPVTDILPSSRQPAKLLARGWDIDHVEPHRPEWTIRMRKYCQHSTLIWWKELHRGGHVIATGALDRNPAQHNGKITRV